MRLFILFILLLVSAQLRAQLVGFKWLHTFNDDIFSLQSCTDKQNNLVITGSFKGRLQLDELSLDSPDKYSVAVMKFTSEGELLWLIKDDVTHVSAITADKDDNILITGKSSVLNGSSSFDASETSFIYITKFSPDGEKLWEKRSSVDETKPPSGTESACITTDNSGAVIIAGWLRSSFSFGDLDIDKEESSAYMIKTDASGYATWVKYIKTASQGYGNAILPNDLITDKDNYYYLTGCFSGQIGTGSTALHSKGVSDIYLMKLSNDGEILMTSAFGGKENDEGVRLYSAGNQVLLLARFGDIINVAGTIHEAYLNYNNSLLIRFEGDTVKNSTYLGYSLGGEILSDICADSDLNTMYTGLTGNWQNYYPVLTRVTPDGENNLIGKILQPGKEVLTATTSMSSDQAGNLYVTGAFQGPVMLNGIYLTHSGSFIGRLDTTMLLDELPVNSETTGDITVYPTLSEGKVTIASITKNLSGSTANIYSSGGSICASFKLQSFSTVIDISQLAGGLYMIEITGDGFTETHKVWKR